jgi:hypothetical protein
MKCNVNLNHKLCTKESFRKRTISVCTDVKLITDMRNTVGWGPRRIPTCFSNRKQQSTVQGEHAIQSSLTDWLCKYHVSWDNKFEIQDTVSLVRTLRKTAQSELPLLKFHPQNTKRTLKQASAVIHHQSRDLDITMGFSALSLLFLWMVSFDWLSGSSSEGSKHCTVCRALCTMEPPESITTPTLLTVRGLATRMQEWGAGGVQSSNPPQTQSQSKGLSLQSSSNLAQNPIPPTRGVHTPLIHLSACYGRIANCLIYWT